MSTTAVILAAGFSTRMGPPNKLLMEVGGKPVVRRLTEAVLRAVDQTPVVVLGHEAGDVKEALSGLSVDFVVNAEPEMGQASSVRLGLETVAEADATFVALGDQPFLNPSALNALLDEHRAAGARLITVPMRGTDRGNPIVLPLELRRSILADGVNIGCGSFTRKNPTLTHRFETNDPGFFFDVDTPDDLARAQDTANERA